MILIDRQINAKLQSFRPRFKRAINARMLHVQHRAKVTDVEVIINYFTWKCNISKVTFLSNDSLANCERIFRER